MMIHRILSAILIGLGLTIPASAQSTTTPALDLLDKPFISLSTGVALRPPAGTKMIRGALGSSEVARFVDEKKNWVLKVSRVLLEEDKPVPLTIWKNKDGRQYPGMLELTVDQFKTEVPGAQILRQDTDDINQKKMGLMAARYNYGLETNLTQQAVIPMNEIQYYIVAMTTPAPRAGELEDDPNVRLAAHTFRQVLESLEFLDQSEVKEDRDDRLRRTRLLFVNLTERNIRLAMQRAQWLRIMRNGRDIGYSYIIEETAHDLPRKGKAEISTGPEGLLVGTRSRIIPEAGVQVDSESWHFSTFDRKYEAFSNINYTDTATGKVTGGDLGVSRWRQKLVQPPKPDIGPRPEPVTVDEYRLEVTRLGRNVNNEPVVRPLPIFYLPQSMLHMIPRLVDRRQPQTYLIAAWVPEASQVMYRYVDVMPEKEVVLGPRRVVATPIKDRIGLEGPLTTHYVSAEGLYLGSINEETQITTVATDQATLQRLWRDANLNRPGDVDR